MKGEREKERGRKGEGERESERRKQKLSNKYILIGGERGERKGGGEGQTVLPEC